MKRPSQPPKRAQSQENTNALKRAMELQKIRWSENMQKVVNKTGNPIPERLSFHGYRKISVRVLGKPWDIYVHKISYFSVHDKIPENFEIDHIDGNKQNCSTHNLQAIFWKDNLAKTVHTKESR